MRHLNKKGEVSGCNDATIRRGGIGKKSNATLTGAFDVGLLGVAGMMTLRM